MKNKKIRINRVKILLLSILILAYSIILQFSIPSIVLCFGVDGHIAFEDTGDKFQCVKMEDVNDHPIHKHKNLSHQEDDCQDLALMTVLSTLYLKKDGKIKTEKLVAASVTLNKKKTDIVPHINLENEDTIVNSSMKSLQVTILLI